MASNQSKAQVAIAASPIHNFPQHSSHITTSNFMSFDLAFARELPKGHYKFNHQSFVRTLSLKRPLFSSVEFYKSAYWVPFRTVWQPFTDFKTDTPHNQPNGTAIISNTPLISMGTLHSLFNNEYLEAFTPTQEAISKGLYFHVYTVNGTTYYYRLNSLGRQAYKIMCQIGCPFSMDDDKADTFSALPLLAVAKCYLDWFYPNAYAHYGIYASLDGIFQRQVTYTLTEAELKLIFDTIYRVSYKSDYFTSAFDNPMTPNTGTFSTDYILKDISQLGNANGGYLTRINNYSNSDNNSLGTPHLTGVASNGVMTQNFPLHNLSQYALNSLHALSDMLQRYGLVGSRALERYLADWGVALAADKLQRSIKLLDKKYPLQVGDVMSTSDTSGSNGVPLGDYSGKAVAYNSDCNFEFDTDEFGMLFIVNTIHPDGGYPTGVRRYALHKTRLDFLTGDFDGLGTQPIECREVCKPLHRTLVGQGASDIFGFKPRYSEYAEDLDTLSGDFRDPNLKTGLLGWETYRQWSDEFNQQPLSLHHSLGFMLGNDAAQYNRIFFDSNNDSDKFMLVHRANYEMSINKKPVYDFYDFEDGKKILMDVNGVKSV